VTVISFTPGDNLISLTDALRVVQPRGGATGTWYNPSGAFDAFLVDVFAWRAINSVGTPWPGGPANYAATLTDEENGQVLVEVNGAVTWAVNTGWQFVRALNQALDTGLIPTNDYSIFIQYSGFVYAANSTTLIGQDSGSDLHIMPDRLVFPNDLVEYRFGGVSQIVPQLTPAGNLGISGGQPYRNGVSDGGNIGPLGAAARSLYIGSDHNFGGVFNPITANINAVVIIRSNAAIVQANALALATNMAVL
jgi:hypothetical protein